MHMTNEDDELPDWSNVVLDEIPNDGNCAYEWAFKKMGVVIDAQTPCA